MAAATVTAQRETVAGSTRVHFYTANIADTNTIATGLKEILAASTNDPAHVTLIAASGGTATFSVTSGPTTGTLVRIEGL